MNLVIDIGNTNTKIAVFNKNQMIEYTSSQTLDSYILDKLLIEFPEITDVCVSNNHIYSEEISRFTERRGLKLINVKHDSNLPITINYKTPKTLGSDRIALAAGSLQYPGDKLIIDLGTCITYDLVLDNQYLGGQISLGINMRLDALNSYTANLPKLDFVNSYNFIGITTKMSILTGIYDSIYFELNNVIEKYKSRYPNVIVILTGSDSVIVKKILKNINFINPYLLIEGLNYIIANNEKT
jgi:type III pantothenate kinase